MSRDRALALAAATANCPEAKQRRLSVLGLIRQLVTPGPFQGVAREPPYTPAELFAKACGDPSGAEYWSHWLDYGEPEHQATLLAAHLAVELMPSIGDGLPEEAAHRVRNSLFAGKRAEWAEVLAALAKEMPTASFRDRLVSTCRHRERRHLVPQELRPFLADDTLAAPAGAALALSGAAPIVALGEIDRESTSHMPVVSQAGGRKNVSERELLDFLASQPPHAKQSELHARAVDEFKPLAVPRALFRAAAKQIPNRRRPGENDRVIRAKKDNAPR